MSGESQEPPGLVEDSGQPGTMKTQDLSETDNCQIMSYQEIMLKNKFDFKKKEKEVQEYGRKLSKIKSRTKLSRRSADSSTTVQDLPLSSSSTHDLSLPNTKDEDINDISEATTPKAKSSLLQKKLVENRKMFEQRSKEITDSNRAVEEKVEALRQKINETDFLSKDNISIVPVRAVSIVSPNELSQLREKDNRILELDTKIHQLEAIIIDLQDHLKEKDSVINARTKAITLMSEDFSKKGKTTLDTLEDTKDEMRSMQADFVLIETSLKDKNYHLLSQLEEKSSIITELEEIVKKLENNHSVIDTNMITELKNEMSLMQENFIFIESSLKDKIENLMSQLTEREVKLSDADEKILKLEKNNIASDLSVNKRTTIIEEKLKQLEQKNHLLESEKKELEKSLVELSMEKDNRIVFLENKLEENSKETNDSENVQKLTKELDELNKTMIKLKAQHKSKLKTLQKKLDDFKNVSDANAELVKLENQVALLEEEKVSTAEMQKRVNELEEKVLAQTIDIQSHVDKIITLENLKFELLQELQSTKQEMSVLEAENADSENLRVTAELKVVDLEEQMDSIHKFYKNKYQSEKSIVSDIKGNETEKEISADDNKVSSSEVDVGELHERMEFLMEKNRQLEIELKERSLNVGKKSSATDSTESFERMSDENNEIIRKISVMEEQGIELSENMSQSSYQKIENLVQENNDLVVELTKLQEKFDSTLKERNNFKSQINELNEKLSSVNILSSQNSDIIIKLTNMELENIQLEGNLKKLTSLESEILHCKKINENQMEFVKNIERIFENSKKEVIEKQEEIDVCQNIMKNFTLLESNYLKMEKIIENLKQEKLTIAEKMNQFENENIKLISQLKIAEKDTISSVQIFSDKIIELETKLIEKDSIIESQQNEMELLKESITKNKQLIEELSGEIVEFKQLIDQLENEKMKIKKENEVLESQAIFKDDSITALEEEFKTTVKVINDQLRDKEMIVMSLDQQIPLLQESLEEKNQNILDLQDAIKTLEGLSSDNEKIFINYQNEIAELQGALNEKEKILSVLQESLDEKEKISNNFEEILKEKENITINLREESIKKDQLIEKYEEKMMSIERQLLEVRDTTDAQENSIRELKSMIDQKEDIISNLRKSETMLIEKIEQIQTMMNDKHSQLEEYVELINRLNGEIDNYKITIKENELKISTLHEDVLNLNNTISEYMNQIARLEDDIVSSNNKLRLRENSEHKHEEMLREIKENKEIIRDLKMNIDEKTTDNQELRAEIETINSEVNKYQGILFEKENFVSSLITEKENFERILSDKSNLLEQQMSYNNQLQTELNDAYRMMEQLKLKHTEDIQMMNDRTQDLIEELQLKSKEFSDLQVTSEENKKMISQNMTEEIRKSFDDKIILLENQLQDTTNNMQNQLQKMKIIAANLKKKTTQCQQLETKLSDYEEKWIVEKSEKEKMNLKMQELEIIVDNKSIQIAKLEQINTESKNLVDVAKENIEKLGNELNFTRDKIEYLMQESATFMAEIAKKHQEIDVKNSEIESLHLYKDALTSEYEEFKSKATAEKALAEEKVKKLENAMDSAHEEIKSLKEQIASLKMVHEEINLNMEHMTTEIEKKSAELAQRGLIINQQATETQQKSDDIEQKSLEIQEKSLEIERKLFEIEEKKIEIDKKSSEAEKLTLEIQRKSLEIEEKDVELAKKSSEIDALNEEFASYKEKIMIEKQQMEISYEDTTEKARELGVRMQVMENEYLEQLNIIQKLKTDNGMLMSKQTQINERLENAEAELLERNKTIEILQNDVQLNSPENQVTQRLIDMLESKLHERNAEIENLDNELATAISNFLQMRESLRSGELASNDHQQNEISNSVVEFNNLLEKNAELERKIREMDDKLISLTTKNSEDEEKILQNNKVAGEAENIEILYSELLEINQAHEIELQKVKNINHELEFEKEELLRKLENLQAEKEHGISKEEKENIMEPQLFDASKLFTTASPWDLESDKEVESLKKHLEERQTMCNKLTEDIAALSQEIQNYKHEIQEINAMNTKITNKMIELTNEQEKQQILCSNYEENKKVLSKNLQSLEVKQNDYLSIINQFMIELKNKTQEESLEMLLELNLPVLSSKLNLILTIIDKLKSSKSQITTTQEKELLKGELKYEKSVQLSSSQTAWNEEIKLDDDEEEWGWNPQEAELSTVMPLAPICSSETQLKAKIAELEDTIKDLENDKIKLNDDVKALQIRSSKLVKKLKEFKIQNEGLQQQLKLQITSGSLNDLDSTIQEEFKCQVEKLEKSLNELKNENNKITLERDQLTRRIDVLMASHERFTELKERQDREIEVLQIQNDELMRKLSNMEREYSEKSITKIKETEKLPDTMTKETLEKKSTEKFNELQESLELLAMENEELKLLFEDEKVSKVAMEEKLSNKLREIEDEKEQRQYAERKLEEKMREFDTERAQKLTAIEKLNKQVRETEDERSQKFILENKLTETMHEIEISKRHVDEMRMNHEEAMKNQHSILLEQRYSEKIQQLESEIIEKSSRIAFLENDLESSQHHLRDVRESLENVTELLNARVQEVADLRIHIQKLQFDKNFMEKEEATGRKLSEKNDEILELLSKLTLELNEKNDEISALSSKIKELHSEREGILTKMDNQAQEMVFFREKLDEKEWLLVKCNSEKSIDNKKISSYEEEINNSGVMINQLQNSVVNLEQSMIEKSQELSEKEEEVVELNKIISELQSSSVGVPICEENIEDKSKILELKTQLDNKLEEIEDWKYILDKNTYPKILQELQDKVNLLYNEKLELETALLSTRQQLQLLSQGQSFSNIQQISTAQQSLENVEEIEKILKFKDEEINLLIRKLESKKIECSLLENALAKQLPSSYSEKNDDTFGKGSQKVSNVREPKSNELDIALYMLHQRDVRCEELTHELMQLLEERDTLQLRLSNAIRLNEEMREILPADAKKSISEQWLAANSDLSSSLVSSPKDKVDLAQKLSQLHNVGHRRDVRLMDDRELRNTQQMSLLAHKDALSTLPPDAAAKLVNANYTLSRDVQSPSSVLLNWLWGKSTPKVVHM